MTARVALCAAAVMAALAAAAIPSTGTAATRPGPARAAVRAVAAGIRAATPASRTAAPAFSAATPGTGAAVPAAWAAVPLASTAAPGDGAAACPALLAHQGYTGSPDGRGPVPADSVPAIADAVRRGARIVELDVRWSADNVPVVIHNRTVAATTRWHGRVAQLRATDLVRMRLRSSAGLTRDRIPTLQRALRTVVTGGATAVVEIKMGRITPAQVASFDAAVYAAGAGGRVSVHSFFPSSLAALPYPAALLTETPVTAVDGDAGVDLRATAVTAGLVRRLHAAHRLVGAWTSAGSGVQDGPAVWSQLARDGVDRIITNDTPGYLAWCATWPQ